MNWEPNGVRTYEEFWNLLKEEGKWIHELVCREEDLEGVYHRVFFATDDWREIDKKLKELHKSGYKGFLEIGENTKTNKPREIIRIKPIKDLKDLL